MTVIMMLIYIIIIACGVIAIIHSFDRSRWNNIFILTFSAVNVIPLLLPFVFNRAFYRGGALFGFLFIIIALAFFIVAVLGIKKEQAIYVALLLLIGAMCYRNGRGYIHFIRYFNNYIYMDIRNPLMLLYSVLRFISFFIPISTCIAVLAARLTFRSGAMEPAFVGSSSSQVSPNTCRHCGSPMDSDSVFCMNCGKRVS